MADTLLQQLAKTDRNPSQESQFQELMRQQGSTGGASGGPGDYASIAREQLRLQQEANAPAVQSLEASIPEIQQRFGQQTQQLRAQQEPLEKRYQNLLSQITANQQKEEGRVGIAGAQELGRRGISSQSGFYDQYQNQQLSPVSQYYTGQLANTGLAREDSIRQLMDQINNVPLQQTEQERAVRNAIAQLQAGGASNAIQQSLGILQNQQSQANTAAELALKQRIADAEAKAKSPYMSVGEGNSVFNPATGQFVATAPKTYAPTNVGNLSSQLNVQPTEPKPTAPPSYFKPMSTSYKSSYYG